MNNLIITKDEFHSSVNNIQAPADGEQETFDKIYIYLLNAQNWLNAHICNVQDFKELLPLKSFIALQGFADAVPTLDLVLTPNGFATVGTNNLVPVSKERIERLIQSLKDNAFKQLNALILELRSSDKWLESQYASIFFSKGIFPNPEELCSRTNSAHSWNSYIHLLSKIHVTMQGLQNNFFSTEFIYDLARKQLAFKLSDKEATVIRNIKDFFIDELCNNHRDKSLIIDTVDFIRRNKEDFPIWHSSFVAKYFDPPIFNNEKKAHGYFF